jgi:hypothetical protein
VLLNDWRATFVSVVDVSNAFLFRITRSALSDGISVSGSLALEEALGFEGVLTALTQLQNCFTQQQMRVTRPSQSSITEL